ncbi:MAG: DUF1566 domain-containing protein [bacterium]|nr:DUF1566 domain-containing protein [bacterium]
MNTASTWKVVDTGQDTCHDDQTSLTCPSVGVPFFGQDAQYAGNQPSYALSGDGLTVYDNVTGLTWTQDADLDGDGDIDVDDKLTFDGAQMYPDTLNAQKYGGYSDWRTPTIKQLYSLIDFRGTDPKVEDTDATGLIPFIDTDYFAFAYGDTVAGDRIIDSQWATSTLYTADNNMMFGVNFADGRIKGYGLTVPDPRAGEKMFFVRCVRGNAEYGTNRFVDNGDRTVTDDATGLMWTQSDSGEGMNWEEALAWSQELNAENHLGYDDWRLPSAKELQGIVDYTRSPNTTGSPAIDPVFDTTAITNLAGETDYPFFWTSTTHLSSDGNGGRAVYLAFGRGLGTYDGATVEDVHGAGCQRSDSKDGDPAEFPALGFGPQGDVQRVFDYVRLVRDVAR